MIKTTRAATILARQTARSIRPCACTAPRIARFSTTTANLASPSKTSSNLEDISLGIRQKIVQDVRPPHLETLADLDTETIAQLVINAIAYKTLTNTVGAQHIQQTLNHKTLAMVFSKRSTRTRVASETSTKALGGHAMFLGSQDIQLGVNETLEDSAKVISSMVDGIMARVGAHSEIEEIGKHSSVPVINALSDLYHPTQILADMATLVELYNPPQFKASSVSGSADAQSAVFSNLTQQYGDLKSIFKGKRAAWVGDTNNITNELMVTLPRFGMHFALAAPKGYDQVDPRVWAKVKEAQTEGLITLTNSPSEALKDADVVLTDTWISMGQEAEKATRMKAFEGYQITNEMVHQAGAKPDWKFMHCLPRKPEEVNDEVFYGERSLVFPEAEYRKWTIMAVFDMFVGRWRQ